LVLSAQRSSSRNRCFTHWLGQPYSLEI